MFHFSTTAQSLYKKACVLAVHNLLKYWLIWLQTETQSGLTLICSLPVNIKYTAIAANEKLHFDYAGGIRDDGLPGKYYRAGPTTDANLECSIRIQANGKIERAGEL